MLTLRFSETIPLSSFTGQRGNISVSFFVIIFQFCFLSFSLSFSLSLSLSIFLRVKKTQKRTKNWPTLKTICVWFGMRCVSSSLLGHFLSFPLLSCVEILVINTNWLIKLHVTTFYHLYFRFRFLIVIISRTCGRYSILSFSFASLSAISAISAISFTSSPFLSNVADSRWLYQSSQSTLWICDTLND